MGLDLAIVKSRHGERPVWNDNNELAYGRKAWEICYELGAGGSPNGKYELTHDYWDDLMKKIAPIGDKLPKIHQAYADVTYTYEGEIKNATPEQRALIDEYEDWYDATWDETPTLGYDFSVGYMQNFWDARYVVNILLDNPDYDVWVIVSY